MQINDLVLQNEEKLIFKLRELYLQNGYLPYRMSKFEEYDLYAKNKDFLVSDNVITFTDTNGKLMALKPDVTLSIIKNNSDSRNETTKLFYNENVYRISKGTNQYKEIFQMGVECFGKVEEKEICDIITLACKSLKELSDNSILSISDIDVLENIVDSLDLSSKDKKQVYTFIGEKNIHELETLLCDNKDGFNLLKSLISIDDYVDCAKEKVEAVLKDFDPSIYSSFINLIETLKNTEYKDMIKVDFSVFDDVNYYNNIVFKGYIENIPNPVLSGGKYDKLMKKLHRKSNAIGFAIYMDELERLDSESEETDTFINVALPKGRLGEKVYNYFKKSGYECKEIEEESRKLIFENKEKGIRYFWVKPSDVTKYVEHGAADIGVAGKDILLEYNPDVYELLDLDLGKCKMAVAAPKEWKDDNEKTLRVATKFSNIAQKYYQGLGRDIDIIHLNGSIEIAPILGLTDVIVDIVETGTTLRENNLEVKADILPISARLISNKTSQKFKNEQIKNIVDSLYKIVKENKND